MECQRDRKNHLIITDPTKLASRVTLDEGGNRERRVRKIMRFATGHQCMSCKEDDWVLVAKISETAVNLACRRCDRPRIVVMPKDAMATSMAPPNA